MRKGGRGSRAIASQPASETPSPYVATQGRSSPHMHSPAGFAYLLCALLVHSPLCLSIPLPLALPRCAPLLPASIGRPLRTCECRAAEGDRGDEADSTSQSIAAHCRQPQPLHGVDRQLAQQRLHRTVGGAHSTPLTGVLAKIAQRCAGEGRRARPDCPRSIAGIVLYFSTISWKIKVHRTFLFHDCAVCTGK